ncbi:UV excision repair protein RAD23 homolog B-like [Anopheles cruzii]|uniref:UV excision repair protein RAD23 homolog B-like n=1 Tax=Anopheles cruzii TaxID=68878 RepID=UPI0022EC84F6|nr:UV excision repair protein RAD23 homolog B-like [Anopheles cruzii]
MNAIAGAELLPEIQKLSHHGTVMEDHNSLSYYNFSGEQFCVKFTKKTLRRPAQSVIPNPGPSEQTEPVKQAIASVEQNTADATAENATETGETSKGASSSSPASSESVGGPLAFLRDDPVFTYLKRTLQEDPSMLPVSMKKIQCLNRDLMRKVTENPENFLKLINDTSEPSLENRGSQGIAATMGNNLSLSDVDAIIRLKELEYPDHLVIQAYIAGERDKYKAADFLVSQTLDDDD